MRLLRSNVSSRLARLSSVVDEPKQREEPFLVVVFDRDDGSGV